MKPSLEEQCVELYHSGLLDDDVAYKCGVSHETIRIWRLRRGLPSHSKRTGRPPSEYGVNMERIKEEYENTKWKPMVHLILSRKEEVHHFLNEIKPNIRRKATCPCKP